MSVLIDILTEEAQIKAEQFWIDIGINQKDCEIVIIENVVYVKLPDGGMVEWEQMR